MKINTPVDPKTEPQEAPESARDSIRAAMTEIKEKAAEENKEVKPEPKKDETVGDAIAAAVKSEAPKEAKPEVKAETKPEDQKTEPAEKTEKTETDDKGEEKVEAKAKKSAPFGASKKLRASWDTMSEDAQEEVSKLLKDNLDTKANAGRKSYLNEVDQVLAPYLPELQKLGATPAQLVDRLLKYSNALSTEQYKYQAIARLAQDFNIDLTMFGRAAQGQQGETQVDDNPADPATAELSAKLDAIMQEFSQLRGNQRADNDKAAEKTVNDWSGFNPTTNEYTRKPYFPYVRQTMSQLIASNTVPLKDGKIDLDAAYDAACYAHPEIREYIMEEQTRALEARKLEEQKQAAAALARTKNAGTSIKPAAPAPLLPSQNAPKKNAEGKPYSVRESLRHAIAAAREARI